MNVWKGTIDMSNDIFEQHGFKIDIQNQFYYTVCKGFHIFIILDEKSQTYVIETTVRYENKKSQVFLQSFLEQYCKKDTTIKSFTYIDYKLSVVFVLNSFEAIIEFIKVITDFLNEQKFIACCAHCLDENFLSDYKMNKMPVTLCVNCFNTIENDLNNSTMHTDLLKQGMKGAFIGSIIALFLWIIVYHYGYIYLDMPEFVISGIGAFLTALFAVKGYEKLSNYINKTSFIYCLILIAGMVFISLYSSMAIELYIEFNIVNSIGLIESFSAVSRTIGLDDGKQFMIDLLTAYSVMFFTQIFLWRHIFQTENSYNKITKLDL